MNTSLIIDFVSTLGALILVIGGITGIFLLLLEGINVYLDGKEQKRRGFLKGYVFPESYHIEVMKRYPHLSAQDVNLALEQLRFYFSICLLKMPSSVAMPSRIVDVCWHIFLCDTRQYKQFCEMVFGDFLHHDAWVEANLSVQSELTVGVVQKEPEDLSEEMKEQLALEFRNHLAAARIYQWSAELEGEGQKSMLPSVPLLFRIDEELVIKDGFFYTLEITEFLANYDLKGAESEAASLDLAAAGSAGSACGDGGGASCGGCGGSV
jgi:hypothetical protein